MAQKAKRQDSPGLALVRRTVRTILPRDWKFRLYFRLMETPGLSELYIRHRGRLRYRPLTRDTPLVIEGFPSSANTYSRQAFLLANPSVAEITSHVHSPRIVHRAVRMRVPCIVLLRDPRDAVASLVQRFPGVRLETALGYYAHYYRRLMPVRHQVVVAPFAEVTHDFAGVIRRCNELYGLDFATGGVGPGVQEEVFRRIEQASRARHGGHVFEGGVARPTAHRQSSDEVLARLDERGREVLDEALQVWREFGETGAGQLAHGP